MSASRRYRLPVLNRHEPEPEVPACLRQALPLVAFHSQRVLEQVEVRSDLNSATPIHTAELEAIEMYLSVLLDELFD
jgi:hypothetical protein